jgi:hypothetical protein
MILSRSKPPRELLRRGVQRARSNRVSVGVRACKRVCGSVGGRSTEWRQRRIKVYPAANLGCRI